jgi:ribonuclease HII
MGKKFDRALIPAAPDLQFEAALWAAGAQRVAGVDEAGRGALAGPVAAAAVSLPAALDNQPDLQAALSGVRDSKEMTPDQRETWAECIRRVAVAWGVGFASAAEIDLIGIVPATRLAIARALQALTAPPDHLLVDFLALPEIPIAQTSLVKGDARSLSIAAASVLAKTARDAHMRLLDREYPAYGFAFHKGYATVFHRTMLAEHGPTPIHRRSFTFVKPPLNR